MENNMVAKKVKYFELRDYVNKIRLENDILYHLDEINESFQEYLSILNDITDGNDIIKLHYWIESELSELEASSEVESQHFDFSDLDIYNHDLFLNNSNISQKGIKDIHKFVASRSVINPYIPAGEYRQVETKVVQFDKDGNRIIRWYGVEPEDIENFMKAFISICKERKLTTLYSSPFLKSSLAHLLFMRIHPFGDGNGRVSRIIQNMIFTSEINHYYNTNLKISPLNISENIKMYKGNYNKLINNIKFDIDADDNEAINRWFNFILNMYDEQLYYQKNTIPERKVNMRAFMLLSDDETDKILDHKAQKSKIKKMF